MNCVSRLLRWCSGAASRNQGPMGHCSKPLHFMLMACRSSCKQVSHNCHICTHLLAISCQVQSLDQAAARMAGSTSAQSPPTLQTAHLAAAQPAQQAVTPPIGRHQVMLAGAGLVKQR